MGRGGRMLGGEEFGDRIGQPHIPHAEQRIVIVHRCQHGLAHGRLDVATGKQGSHRLQRPLIRAMILLIKDRARFGHAALYHRIGIRLRHDYSRLGGNRLGCHCGFARRTLTTGTQCQGERDTGQRTGMRLHHLHDSYVAPFTIPEQASRPQPVRPG